MSPCLNCSVVIVLKCLAVTQEVVSGDFALRQNIDCSNPEHLEDTFPDPQQLREFQHCLWLCSDTVSDTPHRVCPPGLSSIRRVDDILCLIS